MTSYSTYAWKLTYDHLDSARDDTTGPRNADPALVAKLDAAIKRGRTHAAEFPDVEWFRMYDDDGELYYTGVRTGDAGPWAEDGFEPLDDFGTPNAGATEIRYLNTTYTDTEKWETL